MTVFSKSCAILGFSLLVSTGLSGCGPRAASQPIARPAEAKSPASSVRFVDVAKSAGLNFEWKVGGKRPLNILQTIGNGCAFLDYNGDGNLDVLLVARKPGLFRGDGAGHFVDVTHETGFDRLPDAQYLGCAVGDIDNDGFADIYLSGYQAGTLLKNNGGKAFVDISAAAGIRPQPWGTSAAFADLDGDGFLDLYVANYADFGPKTDPQLCLFPTEAHGKVLSSCGPTYYQGIQGVLYQNQSGKRFVDVTKPWGAHEHSGRGLGVAAADYDGSGRVSLAIANDEAPGDLFHNIGPKKFRNDAVRASTAYDRDGGKHGGMGTDWGDYDNDGKLDLLVATYRNETKALYHNDGSGLFSERSMAVGIGGATLPYVAFGAKFVDADNDGRLDIFFANGHVQDNIELIENTTYRQPIQLLLNSETGFEAQPNAALGSPPNIVGRGLAVGDYDNDGRVDALVVDSEGAPLLLHNESGTAKKWVGFAIRRTGPNRDGYGTTITIVSGGKSQVRQCQPGGSYLSSSDPRVHFGLGETAKSTLEEVRIRWPDGKTDVWKDVAIGRYLALRPGIAPE